MQRRGSGFIDVVPADIDRVVALHPLSAIGDAVSDDPHRGSYGKDPFLLGHVFLQHVGLNRPRQPIEVESALLRQGDVHGQQNPGRGIDGHRHRDLFQVDAGKEILHVGQGVNGDSPPPDFAPAHGVVGVVSHQGRHVEIGGQSRLALLDQILEPLVGIGAGPEARDLAHGPPSAPIHGGIGTPGEGIPAGQTDVLQGDILNVQRRIDPLDRKAAQGGELLLPLRLAGQKARNLMAFPGLQLLGQTVDGLSPFGLFHDFLSLRN